jgi:hypothetical protein
MPSGVDEKLVLAWATSGRALRAHLLAYIVEQCERFDRTTAGEVCGPLFTRLSERGGAVFTTNYDRIVEDCCESIGLAYADGFQPGELVSPWTGRFDAGLGLYKLHGSVTWYGARGEPPHFIRLDRGYPLPSPDFRLSWGGTELESLMIVPTLEKDQLRQPYSDLLMRFGDQLAAARLVVVLGSSLRDEHLRSVLQFRSANLVMLVVGRGAVEAGRRLGAMRVAALECETEPFLRSAQPELFSLIDSISETSAIEDIHRGAEEFVVRQSRALAEWNALSDQERAALASLGSGSIGDRLAGLTLLRGNANSEIEERVRPLLQDESPEVRSAAAGVLGSFKSASAVAALAIAAARDNTPSVRLEASLALLRIGTSEAGQALEERRRERPEDRFVEIALADTAA